MQKLNKYYKKILAIFVFITFFCNLFSFTSFAEEQDGPDLEIYDVIFPDNSWKIYEDEEVEFIVQIRNVEAEGTGESRNISVGELIEVSLKIDGSIVKTNSTTTGLNVGDTKYLNLSWVATIGSRLQRNVEIWVNYREIIEENETNNNYLDGIIKVYERPTQLEITNIEVEKLLTFNKTTEIITNIRNNGKESEDDVLIKFNSSLTGQVENLTYNKKIKRDEEIQLSINWTPKKVGSQKISFDVIYNSKRHSYLEKIVVVAAEVFEWWNINWHYRYFITAKGTGNVSQNFNFTDILNDLDISSQSFQKDTIRIVEYNYDGIVINVVDDFYFKEDSEYKPVTNAKGTLIWNISDSNVERYYYIYFDVDINSGVRTGLTQNTDIAAENANISYAGFVEGWSSIITEPLKESYRFINKSINISAQTSAIASNITAFIYLSENISYNYTFYLENKNNGVQWLYENASFNKTGNWTINLTCKDDADYETTVLDYIFYVGKPDLEIKKLEISTDYTPTSPDIYINDSVFFNCSIYSFYATLENINVTFNVLQESSVKHSETNQYTFYIGQMNNIIFEWKANISGEFDVEFIVDSTNDIDELDEDNNIIKEEITVNHWPDLFVENIDWTSHNITQFDEVEFSIKLSNKGSGDAINYTIELFIKRYMLQGENKIIYEDPIDSTLFSIKAGKSNFVKLYWDSALVGKWLVAARVLRANNKKDTDYDNNRKVSNEILTVRSVETNKPEIDDVTVTPDIAEQGEKVTISAEITDDSGLEKVILIINNSDSQRYEYNMIRITNTIFSYDFYETVNVGTYNFEINAFDISLLENKKNYSGTFKIVEDTTKPEITFFNAQPRIQLLNEEIIITAIATDNVGLDAVEVVLTLPSGEIDRDSLSETSENKYVYKDIYNRTGLYSYQIQVEDYAGNIKVSDKKTFWITKDLNDIDSDGMSNEWEEKYGFNPEDPSDASQDFDKDGITNLNEYKYNTNPLKDIFLQNMGYNIKSNIWYLLLSIFMFIGLIMMAIIAKRR